MLCVFTQHLFPGSGHERPGVCRTGAVAMRLDKIGDGVTPHCLFWTSYDGGWCLICKVYVLYVGTMVWVASC